MERTRRNVQHSSIYNYWKDKAITDRGEVILESEADYRHSIQAVGLPEEPHCWGCGKRLRGIEHLVAYNTLFENGEIGKMYNLIGNGKRLDRCHIVPFAIGGSDDPSNLFLLCEECHVLSPDTDNPHNFFLWIYNRRAEMSGCFDGWDLSGMMNQVEVLCQRLGKDPLSGDTSKMNIMNHGNQVSESSIVYGYVDTCKDAI